MKERDAAAAADAACMPMASGFCRLWRLLWLSLSLSLRATHSFLFLHFSVCGLDSFVIILIIFVFLIEIFIWTLTSGYINLSKITMMDIICI